MFVAAFAVTTVVRVSAGLLFESSSPAETTTAGSAAGAGPDLPASSTPSPAASPAEFTGSASLGIAIALRDVPKGVNVRGVVPITAGPDAVPLLARALYLEQPRRLDLTVRYPGTGSASVREAVITLDLSIPNYGGVGSYPIRSFKGGVDASEHARQVVLRVEVRDTIIPPLTGFRNRQVQFINGHRWLRDGRYAAFDDIGGAIHVLEVRDDRVLVEIDAVLYSTEHIAPGFANAGSVEARAHVSGRVTFAALGEVPR